MQKTHTISQRLKSIYDNCDYSDSDFEYRSATDKVRNIVQICSHVPHETILDIGSGDGAVLQRLSDLGFGRELYALEVSGVPLRIMQARGIKNLAGEVLYNGYNIPYPDDRFDLVILSHVVEHLEFPRILLFEASRVGRNVYIEVPLEDNFLLKKDFHLGEVGHINFYNYRTIRFLVQSCGLRIEAQQIRNPSSIHLVRHLGIIGYAFHAAKEIGVHIVPPIAPKLFGYPCCMLCSRAAKDQPE